MGARMDLPGAKFLIAAGAIAGTIGGWILLSLTGAAGNSANQSAQDPALMDLLSRPVPTLAAPNRQTIPGGSAAGTASAAQPTAVPTLRSADPGSAAPPPVTNTQSSR